MSFFDNTKVAGWGLFIIGIILIINAIIQIYDGATMPDDALEKTGFIIAGVGALLAAFVFFGFGNSVRNGSISNKIDILGKFVITYGIATIIANIFSAIGGAMREISATDSIIWIIIGIIIVIIGSKIGDGKTTTFDKILWVILLILFVILFIGNLAGIVNANGDVIAIIANILYAIVYLYMIAFLFDGDVRKKMGI